MFFRIALEKENAGLRREEIYAMIREYKYKSFFVVLVLINL
jgi:hypothetical protein